MTSATTLPAALTLKDVGAALAALEASVGPGPGALVVDAGALKSFDSSAIATLLELRRQAQAVGRAIEVSGAPQAMVDLATLYGVSELLGLKAR